MSPFFIKALYVSHAACAAAPLSTLCLKPYINVFMFVTEIATWLLLFIRWLSTPDVRNNTLLLLLTTSALTRTHSCAIICSSDMLDVRATVQCVIHGEQKVPYVSCQMEMWRMLWMMIWMKMTCFYFVGKVTRFLVFFTLKSSRLCVSVEKPWIYFRASYICESLMLLVSTGQKSE